MLNKRTNEGQEKANQKNRNKKKKMKTWKKVLIVILLLLLAFAGWFTYRTYKNGWGLSGMLATVVGHDENTKKNLPELKVLLLGVSTDLDSELTDTIMVASYNPKEQKASLLSIPRDTYIGKNKNKATGFDKINSVYNIHRKPEDTLKAVNDLTGLDIQYYVVVKTEALIKLVDAIGGVTFNVPIDMKYDDPTQDLHINLKAGEQVIDGDKAEQLLRFRHSNPDKNGVMTTYPEEYGDNDTGRMRTQREFITATLKQTLKPENIFKIGEILDIANQNVETNLEIGYLKDYVPYAVEFNTENLQTDTVPGVNDKANSLWFFFPNEKEMNAIIQKLFFSQTQEGEDANTTNTSNTSSNTTSTSTSAGSQTKSKADIKIEVLNGSGSKAKLEKAVETLKTAGYNVSKTGNTSTISKTIITNKKGLEDEDVKEIKNTLGLGSISNNKTSTSKVHVTIVIGKDFE